MRNRYTAAVQRDGKWFTAFCPEVPGANGQGKSREACLASLAAAIELVLEYKREKGLENAPRGAETDLDSGLMKGRDLLRHLLGSVARRLNGRLCRSGFPLGR